MWALVAKPAGASIRALTKLVLKDPGAVLRDIFVLVGLAVGGRFANLSHVS